jgi:hypothetical protein
MFQYGTLFCVVFPFRLVILTTGSNDLKPGTGNRVFYTKMRDESELWLVAVLSSGLSPFGREFKL